MANHLNDIAKDHPVLVADWLGRRPAIDYAVHHVKAGGHTTPKVFKGWVLNLAPGAQRQLVKRHALKAVTTRRYHAGAHVVDLRINGQVLAEAGFDLSV